LEIFPPNENFFFLTGGHQGKINIRFFYFTFPKKKGCIGIKSRVVIKTWVKKGSPSKKTRLKICGGTFKKGGFIFDEVLKRGPLYFFYKKAGRKNFFVVGDTIS